MQMPQPGEEVFSGDAPMWGTKKQVTLPGKTRWEWVSPCDHYRRFQNTNGPAKTNTNTTRMMQNKPHPTRKIRSFLVGSSLYISYSV